VQALEVRFLVIVFHIPCTPSDLPPIKRKSAHGASLAADIACLEIVVNLLVTFMATGTDQGPMVARVQGIATRGRMKVLIVQSNPDLGSLWQNHMQRQGMTVSLTTDQTGAVHALNTQGFDVIILDLVLEKGSALAVADLASYRYPEAKVIFVTNTSFFSDGSIFELSANACAHLQSDIPPEDLAAMVEHIGRGS